MWWISLNNFVCQKLTLRLKRYVIEYIRLMFNSKIILVLYLVIIWNLDEVVTTCPLRREGGVVCQEMTGFATFATQAISVTCKALCLEREKYLPQYCHTHANTYKFNELLNSKSFFRRKKLCKFIKNINVKVSPLSMLS